MLDDSLNSQRRDLFTSATYREFLERYIAADRENASLSYANPAHHERKDFVRQVLADLPVEYRARLPVYLLARCPICGGRVMEAIDTFGLNGLGWRGSGNTGFGWYGALGQDSRPSYEAECKHARVLAVAVNLNGRQPTDVFQEVWTGSEKPFVMLPLIRADPIFAVIHALAVGNYNDLTARPPYTAYFITHFAGDAAVFDEIIRPFDQDRSRVQYGTADYDLIKWIKAGKLFWLDPTDPSLSLRNQPVDEFPYGQVAGLEGLCVIRDGKLRLYMGRRQRQSNSRLAKLLQALFSAWGRR